MKRVLLYVVVSLCALTLAAQTEFVDPRIGSEGLGRTFIGPCRPFGMAKPGPDCGIDNNAGWAPMPAAVSGFSQTHVSGTGGGPKYGNILVRPFSGPDQHRVSEDIALGYYACTFLESGLRAEVTSARRTSFYRFTTPDGSTPHVEFDLTHYLGRAPRGTREAQQFEDAHLDTLPSNQWQGWQTISGGWNNGAPYTVFFYAQLQNSLLKVAISFISTEQARANMLEDIPHWDFDRTHQECVLEWQALLSRLPISDEATTQVKRMYYTALYHTCLMPTDRRERPDDPVYYDDYYAIWDTYRTSTPLLSLLCPERAEEIAQSLLTIYQRDGYMPDARSGNSNGRTQGGSNAEIVMADALAHGYNLDYRLALEAMLKDATVPPLDDEAEGRGGLTEYNALGYIPYGIPRAGNRTVEYSFCDWAIAQVAASLGEDSIARQYQEQSKRWRNLWRADYEHDGFRGFIMPRSTSGEWLDSVPFGHSKRQTRLFRYTPDLSYEGPWYLPWWSCFMYEASSWEYSFSVPHDVPGLIEACGGPEIFEARLDTFFAHGYYNVANEPSFLTPCLYHWVGKPERSIARVRWIINRHFSDRTDGLPGNDDGGAMSSWLACHILGRYPLAGTSEWLTLEPILALNPRFLFTYKLHGQTRRFTVELDESTLRWSIVRNLKTWHGSYTMTDEALDNATLLSLEQPLDGLDIVLPDDQTFAVLPRKALNSALQSGRCLFDATEWQVTGHSDSLLTLQDIHEGAMMQVSLSLPLPLIVSMQNSPHEINWTAKEL